MKFNQDYAIGISLLHLQGGGGNLASWSVTETPKGSSRARELLSKLTA